MNDDAIYRKMEKFCRVSALLPPMPCSSSASICLLCPVPLPAGSEHSARRAPRPRPAPAPRLRAPRHAPRAPRHAPAPRARETRYAVRGVPFLAGGCWLSSELHTMGCLLLALPQGDKWHRHCYMDEHYFPTLLHVSLSGFLGPTLQNLK